MPLSLTCICGAKLEIDEKFRGQMIPCPDCGKLLSALPPLRLFPKTSGFAVASVLVALIGAFSLVGPLLAIGLGFLALQHIAQSSGTLAGRKFAKAGIGLGIGFAVLSVAVFFWAHWLGLDTLMRGFEWADKLDYSGELRREETPMQGNGFALTRPSLRWGRFTRNDATGDQKGDSMILVNVGEDAYVLVLVGSADFRDDSEECRFKAHDMIRKSPFLRKLGRLGPKAEFPELTQRNYKQIPNTDALEFELDLTLVRVPRTMLVRVHRFQGDLFVVVCLARAQRFGRLDEAFREVVESFKVVQ